MFCPRCRASERKYKTGKDNPQWRGGLKWWGEGRRGTDKDGLHWKIQRRLCVERDGNKCQDTECVTPHLRICVHHKKPYRISFSHALENLVCLCDKCHGKQESLIQENWGGRKIQRKPDGIKIKIKFLIGRRSYFIVFPKPKSRSVRQAEIKCCNCNHWTVRCRGDKCKHCLNVDKAVKLRKQGKILRRIGKELGISNVAVYHRLKKMADKSDNRAEMVC